MGSPAVNQLELATELVEVLSQIAAAQLAVQELGARRDEILTSLHDGLQTPVAVSPQPPDEPKQTADEAMALYEAGVEKMTTAQSRMIWALLSKNHGVDEENAKRVIRGIVAQQHLGATLESTKDLSKAWAIDLITYLQEHPTKDLEKWIVPF